jgi:hypothetical protein
MLILKRRFAAAILTILALIAAMVFSQTQSEPAQASHYRGTLVTAEYHAPGGGHAEEVHITATGLTAKGTPGGFSQVTVYRDVSGVPTQVTGCSGNSGPTTAVDNSNPLFEITVNTWTITGCFATAGNYTFTSTTSARISGIQNTTNSSVQFASKLAIDGANDTEAPIYNAGYMYNIAYDVNLNYSTNLGGLGQGNTPVTYALVTDQTSSIGGYGASRVPCSDLNLATGDYRINSSLCTGSESITTAFGGSQKYYTLKVRATDANGQYSTRDVLLNFDTTTNQPPAFTSVPASGAFTVTPGTTSTVQFCAQDPDVSNVLGFTFSPTRNWITASGVTTVSPATTPNTYCITFTLAPPVGTTEAFNFEVSVFDNNNSFVRSASNLYSFQAGAVLPNSTPSPTPSASPSVSVFVPTGPQVTSISPNKIFVGTNREVKITGERLNGVTKFVVRGIPLTLKSNTAFEIVFEMPAQLAEGYADISFETPQGSLSWGNALRFVAVKNTQVEGSAVGTYSVSGFLPGSAVLTSKIKAKLNEISVQIQGAKSTSCTGFTMGPSVLPVDASLGLARAKAVCAYLNMSLPSRPSIAISKLQDPRVGAEVRRVEIKISK